MESPEEYHSMSGNIMALYKDQDFTVLHPNSVLFNDEKTAQRYADYLNTKEK